jgi:hypothetical protein
MLFFVIIMDAPASYPEGSRGGKIILSNTSEWRWSSLFLPWKLLALTPTSRTFLLSSILLRQANADFLISSSESV